MKLKLKRKNLIIDFCCLGVVIGIIFLVTFFMTSSNIKFIDERNIEINSVVDYTTFIKDVHDGSVADVKIDSSHVNTQKLGDYTVVFKYKDEENSLKVKVVDTVAPEFDVVSQTIALNQKINPESLVKNIKDATKTTIKLKKDIMFNQEGKQNIDIVVTDEAKNSTTKTVEVIVKKDTIAPKIKVSNETFVVGQKVDLKKIAVVSDDMDKNPVLTVNETDFDVNKVGTYTVEYVAKDASGNETKTAVKISIVNKTSSNQKVVYLTFDDGPSKFTPEVLKILDQYNCKATFFITGMNSSYRKYIKESADRGHTIGLHTYSHNYSKVYSSVNAYFEDLTKIGNLAKDYLGYVPKYIRFPGGSSNAVSKKYSKGIMSQLTKMVEEKGYIYYDWNAENGDGFSGLSKAEMLKRATSSKASQIMILMHDANGKQTTIDILPQVIEYYQDRGYTFKAIDDSTFVPHQRVNN